MDEERREELDREHIEGQEDPICECGSLIEHYAEGDDTQELCEGCR